MWILRYGVVLGIGFLVYFLAHYIFPTFVEISKGLGFGELGRALTWVAYACFYAAIGDYVARRLQPHVWRHVVAAVALIALLGMALNDGFLTLSLLGPVPTVWRMSVAFPFLPLLPAIAGGAWLSMRRMARK